MAAVAFNPLHAVGMLYGVVGSQNPMFLGSCFSLRDSTAVLTAAHCVEGLSPDQVFVRMPVVAVVASRPSPPPVGIAVTDIVRHGTADAALLRLRIVDWAVEPFWDALPLNALGQDVMAYGYPEDVRSDEPEPTARLFRGYVQRVYEHVSRTTPCAYRALELDFACPGGLSGGPVFAVGAQNMVLGIATENLESTTYLDAVEEVSRDGDVKRTQYQRVINYGVALSMDGIKPWLDENLRPFDPHAFAARRKRAPD